MVNEFVKARRALSIVAFGITMAVLATSRPALGQVINAGGFLGNNVGGVFIDTNGVLVNAERDNLNKLRKLRVQGMGDVPGDLNRPAELRKVSLRGLSAAIEESRQKNQPLSDDVKYLAGLQRVRYVFVYPEQNDIVLAGYGEGWKVGPTGEIIGATTGLPVLLLDDLVVALRSALQAAQGGISCSIDPTAEGLTRLKAALKHQETIGDNPQATIRDIEQVLGPQTITLAGVPATSHFARVLVAADYRMKRLAMDFDPPPVPGLPSYLQLLKPTGRGMQSMLPRWWLATNYQPLLTDEEGLAWELRGPGVKAMTEEDFLAANGERVHSGKASPAAQKWADNMTAKYEALSAHDPIFGQLRNCMDLAVVAALVFKENLAAKASCDLSALTDEAGMPVDVFAIPKQVASQASFRKKGDNYIISASGGVLIYSWGVADRKEQSNTLSPIRAKAADRGQAAPTTSWRWN